MGNRKSVIVTMGVSVALVLGLVFIVENKNGPTSEVLIDDTHKSMDAIDGPLSIEEQLVSNPEISNTMNPTAIITTNQGVVELELFEDQMPITVANFVKLTESNFYDGIKFHRVIEGFMIQGGDPNSRGENEAIYGQGGPDENVQDEFVAGDVLTNTRGTIAMANTGQPNSGGSQWFINLVDNTNLDFDKQPLSSKHPVFGRVTTGLDVVDTIGKVATKGGNIPVEPVVIETIAIVRQ
ncbi:MAG: peptidylprolyl isomerase [Candidatus Azotimanducaceae bacterium]|jgi:peptidylprolyl isomerase